MWQFSQEGLRLKCLQGPPPTGIAFYPYEKTKKCKRTYIVSMMMALHKYQTAPLAEFVVKRSAEVVPELEKCENLCYDMKASGMSAYMKLWFEVVGVGCWMAWQVLMGIDCTLAQGVPVHCIADCNSSVELAHDFGVGGMVAENVTEADVSIVAEVCIVEQIAEAVTIAAEVC